MVGGGWGELQPFTELGSPAAIVPLRQQVDGERIFITESRSDEVRVVVRDPEPHEVAFATDEIVLTATFADDLVAFARSGGDQKARASEAARATMASVVEGLATLPEQPCRLCPKYIPPARQAR